MGLCHGHLNIRSVEKSGISGEILYLMHVNNRLFFFFFCKVELEVLELFSHTRRPPGEPIIQLELSQSSTVTENNLCSDSEKKRRQAVGKMKIWIRVRFWCILFVYLFFNQSVGGVGTV